MITIVHKKNSDLWETVGEFDANLSEWNLNIVPNLVGLFWSDTIPLIENLCKAVGITFSEG